MPEFHVESERGNPHGAAILIVGGIRDVLKIDTREKTAEFPSLGIILSITESLRLGE